MLTQEQKADLVSLLDPDAPADRTARAERILAEQPDARAFVSELQSLGARLDQLALKLPSDEEPLSAAEAREIAVRIRSRDVFTARRGMLFRAAAMVALILIPAGLWWAIPGSPLGTSRFISFGGALSAMPREREPVDIPHRGQQLKTDETGILILEFQGGTGAVLGSRSAATVSRERLELHAGSLFVRGHGQIVSSRGITLTCDGEAFLERVESPEAFLYVRAGSVVLDTGRGGIFMQAGQAAELPSGKLISPIATRPSWLQMGLPYLKD